MLPHKTLETIVPGMEDIPNTVSDPEQDNTTTMLLSIGCIAIGTLRPSQIGELDILLTKELVGSTPQATKTTIVDRLLELPDYALAPVTDNVLYVRRWCERSDDQLDSAIKLALGRSPREAEVPEIEELSKRYSKSRNIKLLVGKARQDLSVLKDVRRYVDPSLATTGLSRSLDASELVAAKFGPDEIIEQGIGGGFGNGREVLTLGNARTRTTAIADMLLWAFTVDDMDPLNINRELLQHVNDGHIVEDAPRLFPTGNLPRYTRLVSNTIRRQLSPPEDVVTGAAYHGLDLVTLARDSLEIRS